VFRGSLLHQLDRSGGVEWRIGDLHLGDPQGDADEPMIIEVEKMAL
jgi:hypothetical protein